MGIQDDELREIRVLSYKSHLTIRKRFRKGSRRNVGNWNGLHPLIRAQSDIPRDMEAPHGRL